jgi:gamma-glutamyl-gamma-aminobutyrate hydrolase PuuD
MMKIFAVGIAFAASTSLFACEIPQGESLVIGCTYHCDFFYRFRLTMTSWALGYPLKIVNLDKSPDLKAALKSVDGVLVPGGADIDPKYYLDSVKPDLREYTLKNLKLVEWSEEGRQRDPFEYDIVKLYSTDEDFKNLPMLGICRGLQMMSVAQGIPLYLDIKTEVGIRNRRNLFDHIRLESSQTNLIDSIYRPDSFHGFKLHHQGIRVPYYEKNFSDYPLTKVTAYSNNRKIAEAIEYTHRPALGVQYHPERSFSGTSVPVFRWFLTKACENKNSSMKDNK